MRNTGEVPIQTSIFTVDVPASDIHIWPLDGKSLAQRLLLLLEHHSFNQMWPINGCKLRLWIGLRENL